MIHFSIKKSNILLVLFIQWVAFLSYAQPTHTSDTFSPFEGSTFRSTSNGVLSCNRTAFIEDYIKSIDRTTVTLTQLNWTGDVTGCIPGTISNSALEKTLIRINYFRRLAGVKDSIIFRSDYNQKCQEAALMMRANNTLNHTPPNTWICYTEAGKEAAGKSNLSSGPAASAAINQYIQDLGSNNAAVGHRRWILYHRAKEFGFGSTNNGTALWVIGPTQIPKVIPEFIAYPNPGYFPKALVYPRWSFSIPGANFTSTKIEMRDEKDNIIPTALEPLANTQGFGDNTIVWVPSFGTMPLTEDKLFKIKVDSVRIGALIKNFEYNVLCINTTHPVVQKSTKAACCGMNNGSIKIKYPPGYKSIRWSNGITNQDSISNLANGIYYVTITDKLDCEFTDSIHLSNLTSTHHPSDKYKITISPNPTSDLVHIRCEGSVISSVEIIDYLGRIVQRDHAMIPDGSTHQMHLSHIPTGIYHMKVTGKDFRKMITLFKK